MNLSDGRLVADAMKSMVNNENVNIYSMENQRVVFVTSQMQ